MLRERKVKLGEIKANLIFCTRDLIKRYLVTKFSPV